MFTNLANKTTFSKTKTKFLMVVFPLILVSAFLFINIDKARAATYYVSTSGTDDASHGTGTGANAWLTLNYALTGSRVAKGDTVIIEAGTYSSFNGANTYIQPAINTASGSGPVIIQAADGATVTLNVPANTVTWAGFFWLNSSAWTELTFRNINFTNTSNVATRMFWQYGHNLTFEDCTFTLSAVATHAFWVAADTEDANLTFTRSTIIGGPTSGTSTYVIYVAKTGANITVDSSTFYDQTSFVFSANATGINYTIKNSTFYNQTNYIFITSTAGTNFTVESSLFYDQTNYLFYTNASTDYVVTNCTFFTNYPKFISQAGSSGSTYTIRNNIFYADTTTDYRPFAMVDAIMSEIISTPANWNVTNNIWYRASDYQNFISGRNHFDQVDATNHFINPQFTATTTHDFTIQNGSYVCGHGLQAALPASGDVTGAAWTGNDVGAYKCPSSSTGVTLLDKVAFVGDSIMAEGTAVATFNNETGVDYVAAASAAISGATMQKIFDFIDTLMINSSPDTVLLSIGINNLATVSPSSATTDEYVNYLVEMMQKIEDWGATPIWLGIGTLNNYGGYDDESVTAINAAMETACTSHSWTCDAYYDQMTFNSTWQSASPNGYYDTDGNVHPNTSGYQLIGKFAEYLYSTKHTIGTDEIDIGAGARVYANGKFRDKGTTSGSTASLSVTPESGSFTNNNFSYWLDIGIDSWLTSGTYNKQWTASTTVSTTTVYTIGDLAPNKYYTFKVDGTASTTAATSASCTAGVCQADSSGNLTFTYAGGYSVHTFALEQNTDAPTNIGLTSITADSTSQLTILADTATDSDPGLSATPYWFDETTGGSGATDSADWQASTSFSDSGLSSNTQYTYRVKAKDGNDNESDYSTTLSKYTLAPTPSGFAAAAAGRTSINLSVNTFNNSNSGSSGYLFSGPNSNSGWVTNNSWADSNLQCGHSYTYTIKYRNGDGVETATATASATTASCGGGGVRYLPSYSPGDNTYSVLMGQSKEIGNISTEDTNIYTYINSPLIFSLKNSQTKYAMTIIDLDTITGLINIKLAEKTISLLPGENQNIDLDNNGTTDLQITYKKLQVNQVSLTLSEINQSAPGTKFLANGNLVKTRDNPAVYLIENGYKRHIADADTFTAKGFSWSDIIDVSNLDNYPSGKTINISDNDINNPPLTNNYTFTANLPYGSVSDGVLQLQKFLNANGFILTDTGPGSPGHETRLFGRSTRAALIKFQNKYKQQILEPLGLRSGTGYFGKSTRDFINNSFSN